MLHISIKRNVDGERDESQACSQERQKGGDQGQGYVGREREQERDEGRDGSNRVDGESASPTSSDGDDLAVTIPNGNGICMTSLVTYCI